jgi:hypothetical protein
MATVINNPGDNSGGAGMIIGLVVAVIIIAIIFIYGIPALRGTSSAPAAGASVNVTLPSTDNTGGAGQ